MVGCLTNLLACMLPKSSSHWHPNRGAILESDKSWTNPPRERWISSPHIHPLPAVIVSISMQLSLTADRRPLRCRVGLHQHAGVVPDFHALSECFAGSRDRRHPCPTLATPPRRAELLDFGQWQVGGEWIHLKDTIPAKRSSRSSGVKTTSVSRHFARRSLTSPPCLSHLPFCQGASASTITCKMPAYSADWAKSPRNSGPPSVIVTSGVPK